MQSLKVDSGVATADSLIPPEAPLDDVDGLHLFGGFLMVKNAVDELAFLGYSSRDISRIINEYYLNVLNPWYDEDIQGLDENGKQKAHYKSQLPSIREWWITVLEARKQV